MTRPLTQVGQTRNGSEWNWFACRDAYEPDLAASLNNLFNLLAEVVRTLRDLRT